MRVHHLRFLVLLLVEHLDLRILLDGRPLVLDRVRDGGRRPVAADIGQRELDDRR